MTSTYYASVSGGKDSLAMCLHLQDEGIPFSPVFFDTGWEHPDTYRYLRVDLPDIIGEIRWLSNEPHLREELEPIAQRLEGMLGHRSAMVRWILHKGMFPSRVRRFCTQEMKMACVRTVMREAFARDESPVNCVGIRRGESVARSQLLEREIAPALDCMVWRPIIDWTERQVIDRIRSAHVAPNPLYLRGSTRVGCWPCIMSNKGELRQFRDDDPRIAVIEALEAEIAILARQRAEQRGETLDNPPSFFQRATRDGDGRRPTIPVREHLAWARTARGKDHPDAQTSLPGLNDGCVRWGLCDLGSYE